MSGAVAGTAPRAPVAPPRNRSVAAVPCINFFGPKRTRIMTLLGLILKTYCFFFFDKHNPGPVAYAILTGVSYPVVQNFLYQQHGVLGNYLNFCCMYGAQNQARLPNGPGIWDY